MTTVTKPSKAVLLEELRADRLELFTLLQNITPEEWNTQSLCTEWRVRDVVAHLIYSTRDLKVYLKERNPMRTMAKIVELHRNDPLSELLEAYKTIIEPNRLEKLFPAMVLHDHWIHQQDIRWVLGAQHQTQQYAKRVNLLLNMSTRKWAEKVPGIQLVSEDTNLKIGKGSPVLGKAEALTMALARRPLAFERLSGEGKPLLKARLKM